MCETKVCKVCGEEKPIGHFKKTKKIYRESTCRMCIYKRDFKSTKIPRKPVKKFSGVEPVSMRSKASFRKSSE